MPRKRKSLATKARYIAKKRAMEDAETRENRLYHQRMRQAYLRARETTPERIQRLSKQRMRQSSLRATRLKNEMKLIAMRVEEEQRLKRLFTESAPKKRKRCRRPKKISHSQELKQSNYTTCCAPTCNNTSETHVLTRLPLDSERRQQWLSRINREAWTTCKNSALCQIHFAADAWLENAIGEKVLKDDALPSMNLHNEAIMSCDNSGNFSEVRISADEAKNEDSVSSIYIKEEPLEPDIEMTDDDGIKQPFEAVYLNSNFAKCGDELIEISNIKVEEPNEFQEETEFSEREPSDFIDKQQQDTITLSCLECNQYFDEKQDLDLHLQEKHSEKECTTRQTEKQDNSPCKLIESMKMLVQKKLKVCDPILQIASPNLKVTLASTTTCCSSTSTRS